MLFRGRRFGFPCVAGLLGQCPLRGNPLHREVLVIAFVMAFLVGYLWLVAMGLTPVTLIVMVILQVVVALGISYLLE